MKTRPIGLIFALLLLGSGPALAQEATLLGTVANEAGDPMPGVQVYVDGLADQGLGTFTNQQGRYRIAVPASLVRDQTVTLVAQSIGYSTVEEDVTLESGTHVVDFVLRQTALSLDEIVVTGVVDPVQGKKLPFTVGRVSAENVATVPATGAALQSLQGKVAGVNITRPSGQPGEEVSIQLRTPTTVFTGNEPLYVVDGVILGAGTIDLEALDIESIEVIKGAAAASLYGSRAAAGVIQIRTARGSGVALDQTRFTYRSEAGASALPRRIPSLEAHWRVVNEGEPYTDSHGRLVRTGDMLDRDGDLGCRRFYPNCEGFANNPGQIADQSYIDPLYDHIGTFYKPGRFLMQSFGVSRNSEKTNFLTSFNLYDEAGSIPGHEGFERYNFRFNLDHRIMDNLSLSFSGYHNRSFRETIDEGESGATGQGAFFQLMRYRNEFDIGKIDPETGLYVQFPDSSYWQENPLFLAQTRDNWEKRSRTLGNIALNYSPAQWLRISGQFSYDRLDRNNQWHLPAGTPINPFSGNPETFPSPGLLDLRERTMDTQNGSLRATLTENFGLLNSRLTFAGSFESRDLVDVQTRGEDFAVLGTSDVNLARDRTIRSTNETIRANGYFADLALDYSDKYIGSFLVRQDGSSLFGPEERWHTYFRTALAYRVSEEPWWPFADVITEFKPRYSLGTAGNRPDFAFQYETWDVDVSADGQTVTFTRGTLGNRALKPEFAREQEVGLDVALYDRYLLQLTYATQRTEDMILRRPQRAVTGYQYQWDNIGTIEGTALEMSLEASLIQSDNLRWTATFVGDQTTSTITEWPIAPLRDGLRIYDEGNSLYDIYGSQFLTSLDQLADIGLAGFEDEFDVNDEGYVVWVGAGNTWRDGLEDSGTGRVNWETRTTIDGVRYDWGWPVAMFDPATGEQLTFKIGSMKPDFSYGFLSNVTWKGLSVHAHLRGQIGGDVYNYTRQRMYRLSQHGDLDQRGKSEETKKSRRYYQRGLYNNNIFTDPFVEDATFLKLQAIQLAYTFNRGQLGWLPGSMAPQNLTLGITGRNLFTLTGYSGYDPDVGTVLNRYDAFGYPNLRQLTATVEITF
ncbi:MAG: SusC/RagA family TonB-linked outer membrane protein [Longimicrobiales bacterium]|nr:SusC/RagA family TonB-linked outer membrane protein [Longimicrobiales bacterium]